MITRRDARLLNTPPNARCGRLFVFGNLRKFAGLACGTPCKYSPVIGQTARDGFRSLYLVAVLPPGVRTNTFRMLPDLCLPDTIVMVRNLVRFIKLIICCVFG